MTEPINWKCEPPVYMMKSDLPDQLLDKMAVLEGRLQQLTEDLAEVRHDLREEAAVTKFNIRALSRFLGLGKVT